MNFSKLGHCLFRECQISSFVCLPLHFFSYSSPPSPLFFLHLLNFSSLPTRSAFPLLPDFLLDIISPHQKKSEYNHNCIRSVAQGCSLEEHLLPELLALRSSAVQGLSYNAPEITVHFWFMFYSFKQYTAALNSESFEKASKISQFSSASWWTHLSSVRHEKR